jgi:murein DD-endopeptidase MepM/ murein hydrolase activator NlpD
MKIFKIIIFLFLFLHLSVEVNAKILRYVDENGIVTYTDDEEKASAYDYDEYDDLGEPSPDKVFFNYDKISGKLFINNTFNSEITVKVHVSSTDNVESDVLFDHPLEIPANTEYLLGYFKYYGKEKIDLTKTFDIGKLYKGDTSVYYTTTSNDLLVPFLGAFKVTQGWNGKFTHKGPKSKYAIDIAMPQGTPIIAVKSGKIVDMKINSTIGGPDPKYRSYANYIRIAHDDGSMSIYVHLMGNSNKFSVGDVVLQGQVIALSGNTGYSTGPHLHFALQTNTGDGVYSIKYKFYGKEPVIGTVLSNSMH